MFFEKSIKNDIIETITSAGEGQFIRLKKIGLYRITVHITHFGAQIELRNSNQTATYKAANGGMGGAIQIDFVTAYANGDYILVVTPDISEFYYADNRYSWATIQYLGTPL